MKRVFVCAGMRFAADEKINNQAKQLGKILANMQDVVYVQGGSDQGLMGETLKEFIKYSKNVEFLIPDTYYDYDIPALLSLVGEKDFKASKTRGEAGRLEAIKKCDHIVVMPGGTGTLEELLYCNETSRAKEHESKVTVVNINGFYNGFLLQVETNIKQGLSKPSVIKFEMIDDVNKLEI